jgi:large subunit ribosomal protein L18
MDKRLARRRAKKALRVRSRVQGTSARPRLTVFRSLNHIYAQLIDDANGTTLLAASTKTKEIQEQLAEAKGKVAKSAIVGEYLGKKAIEAGIEAVVFDKGWYKYHGRIKALADGARKAGLKF